MQVKAIKTLTRGMYTDHLVAEEVMGWEVSPWTYGPDDGYLLVSKQHGNYVADWSFSEHFRWSPSSRIKDAWRVVEAVTEVGRIRTDGFLTATVFYHLFKNSNLCFMNEKEAAIEICQMALIAVIGEQ